MNKDKAGFTIVELIISILVLGIIIAALSSLFLGIQNTQNQTVYKENATRAAQREVESLRNNNYNSLSVGTPIDFSSELSPKLPKGSTGSVVVSEPSAGLKRVDVTVTYPDGGKTHKVTLSSLIGVIGITQ
jgi:prepilin-type N-terminal cleavage/methylation domain-containing protein